MDTTSGFIARCARRYAQEKYSCDILALFQRIVRLMLRLGAKKVAQAVALLLAFPCALVTIFGRFQPMFMLFAHILAVGPGLPGDLLRSAYYRLTLRRCSLDTTISYGTYFVRPQAEVGPLVSIGSYCVIGGAIIGKGTQIGSHVLIPGGQHQHDRDAHGNLTSSKHGEITIGSRCWIGDGAILMADIGQDSTIGAGAVVAKPIPSGVTAVGNPARPLNCGR
jgi:virginiamycin A acetyltransferase